MATIIIDRSSAPRIILTGILLIGLLSSCGAQSTFPRLPGRGMNTLDIDAPCLKTIYTFQPVSYDTILLNGPDPLIMPEYREEELIRLLFDAVFTGQIKVYNPNFWGTIPQFMSRTQFEEFDTLDILKYLSAGWDTSLLIDDQGFMEAYPVYRQVPYQEIRGIFFFESWWLDHKKSRMYKDVSAYLPIREYLLTPFNGYENTETRRRLLFMVIPEWSGGSKKKIRYRPGNFRLIARDLRYEVKLYNKPYEFYLYREEDYGRISETEFNEWQYHYFDFYRHFDADMFLEKLIDGILAGKLRVCPPEMPDRPMSRDEFLGILFHSPGNKFPLPEDYPVSELNSIVFHEDWYIHPENFQIFKDIKAITVNRSETLEDQYTGEFIRESVSPIFTIWFER